MQGLRARPICRKGWGAFNKDSIWNERNKERSACREDDLLQYHVPSNKTSPASFCEFVATKVIPNFRHKPCRSKGIPELVYFLLACFFSKSSLAALATSQQSPCPFSWRMFRVLCLLRVSSHLSLLEAHAEDHGQSADRRITPFCYSPWSAKRRHRLSNTLRGGPARPVEPRVLAPGDLPVFDHTREGPGEGQSTCRAEAA
jgi:hypothetical protein